MPLMGVAQLFGFTEPKLLKEAQRITIPTGHIDVGTNIVMIKLCEETHEVMNDVAAG